MMTLEETARMSEHEMVKVYELAKELGIDSISLLDKLKTLNIKVKNHMSELGDEEVKLARSAFKKEAAGSATPAKKAPVRARKKAAETTATATPTVEAAPSAEKKSASPVIRRRTQGGTEATETTIVSGTPPRNSAEAAAAAAAAEQAAAQDDTSSLQFTEITDTFVEVPAQDETEVDTAAAIQADPDQAPESDETTTVAATPSVPQPTQRKPIVLTPRPVAPPRKSILKIVEAAPPPMRPMIKPTAGTTAGKTLIKPAIKGAATQDKDGFRIIKMTKENLDQMVEEEAAKKRGGGGGREQEIRPEDVRFADYRKKEMVFLPKKKKIPVGKEIRRTQVTTPKAQKRVVEMQETITVGDLADQMGVKAVEVVRKLMGMGHMANINQSIDFDTASLIVAEYKYEVKNVAFKEADFLETAVSDTPENLKPRPPVVTVMGHVDHGKTSLLDAIREADVAGGEAGGITQHIGAYTVEKEGKLITFIDTPGHEAFTVMRARGANVTDIVILVVAADDGVMPQTREALAHAKAAGVPIIVAVNKIDKAGASVEKAKQDLAALDLLPEDWGGQTMFVPVSATKKTNIDKLLESILLQAEVLDLKANPDTYAGGSVLEARLERGRGPVVSVLVKRGTLKVGDAIVSGSLSGKVKAMMDAHGKAVNNIPPGIAVEVLGFEGVPSAGDSFDVVPSESDARNIATFREDKAKAHSAATNGRMSLEDFYSKSKPGAAKELNVVLKADVFGSVEAIRDALIKASTEKVKVKVIHAAPGGVTESDVLLAGASNAIIIGFNVRPETKARQVAESQHVDIRSYSIIYEVLDDIKKAMVGLLEKKKVEKFLGRAEVRQTFSVPKLGTVAGSAVVDGKIVRGANVRLLRDSRIIFEGKMSSLRRFKDDAKEVATGFECGIGIENYNDLKPGDIIEAYQIELVTPELNA